MRYFLPLCCLFLFCSCTQQAIGQQSSSANEFTLKKTQKVLFVGNSYTYYWNLPMQVQLLAEDRGIDLIASQSTNGGVNLGQHWNGERNLNTKEIIAKGDYDVVVLQDHSMRTIQAVDSLYYYGDLLDDYAADHGAETLVYMTWAREFNPLMQAQVTKGYTELAKKIEAPIAPVGLAFEMARDLRPDLEFFTHDGSHPSLIGTYLAACVFFKALTGETPVGLTPRLEKSDGNGGRIFYNQVDPNDAVFLQQIADKVVK